MNENFDRQNHLPQQIILPLPLITKNPLMNPQSFQTGGRGRKSIFAILSVFPCREITKIHARIAFASTNFVQDCS